jgi:hypothetical protein
MTTPAIPAVATSDSYARMERRVFAIFMIVAPLILIPATIIHPKHGIGATDGAEYFGAAYDHTVRFYIAHTGYFLTATTLIVAAIGLTWLVRPTHPKAAFWGLVLTAMGFVGWGAIDGMDFMTFNAGRYAAAGGLDFNTMQTYIDDALADQAVLIPVFGVFSLAIIGLTVTAVGLHRAGVAPFWRALLLPIGIAGVISFLDYPVLEIASGIFVATALLPIGVRQFRAPDEPLDTRTNLVIAGAVAAYVIVLMVIVAQTPGGLEIG